MTTQFRLLGPLQAKNGGGQVRLNGPKRRALTAYLLVHRDAPSPIERIVDSLWDGAPSAGAEATVRTYVSQLRRLFADDGPKLVLRHGGYVLDVDPDCIDAVRFERAVSDALAEPAAPRRLACAGEALELWGGAPLDEFTGSAWADDAARRWTRLRMLALERRVDALLEMDRPTDALVEVEAAVDEHPLHEPLWIALMLARYRCGRQADALRAAREARKVLASDLGIDPGPELIDLEQRILTQDPALLQPEAQLSSTARGASPLPTGTLTFLFTDVEGSTRLLHELGDRYGELLELHRTLIRDAVGLHGGREFGTEGDALFVVFDSAKHAIAAASDAQRALSAGVWPDGIEFRVRMALHTGDAAVIDDDYVGMPLHVVARLCAAARGGQVLLSSTTRTLADGVDVESLGVHRLRDVPDPVEIFQLRAEGLIQTSPPFRTLSAGPNNLPNATDELVGRDLEIVEVAQALRERQLVTLTGPGGAGKTRLALEVASDVLPGPLDGVWFVPLGAATMTDQVEALIAQALGIGEHGGAPLSAVLRAELARRDLVLVLDNCEHLVDAVASLVADLVAHCPSLRVLTTSREVLGVRGEHVIVVAPLGDDDATRLFVARARSAAPGFNEATEDFATVAEVCRRLDGLPLAIELAAARLRGVSLRRIAERLDDRFGALGAAKGRTLEAVVAWSYELLTPAEQAVFRRLSVFPDSFDLDACERVACWGEVEGAEVVDAVARLVDTSMLLPVRVGDDYRYRLLETLRAYGRDRLEETGECDDCVAQLHRWASNWVQRLEADMRTPRQDATLAAANLERENLRAVYERALATGDELLALRIVTFAPIMRMHERGAAIDALLPLTADVLDELRGHALTSYAQCAFSTGKAAEARAAAGQAAVVFERLGDRRDAAWARYFEIFSAWGLVDDDDVRALLVPVLQAFRELDEPLGVAYLLWVTSQLEHDADVAEAHGAESEELFRSLGATFGLAHALEGRALVCLRRHKPARAAAYLIEAVRIFAASPEHGCLAHGLEAAAALIIDLDLPADATDVLAVAEDLRSRSGQAHRPWELRARAHAEDLLAGRQYEHDREAGHSADLNETLARTLQLLEHASATFEVDRQ